MTARAPQTTVRHRSVVLQVIGARILRTDPSLQWRLQ